MIGSSQRLLGSSIAKTLISCVTMLGLISCGIDAQENVSIQDADGIIGKGIAPDYADKSNPVHSMVFIGEDRGSGVSLCGGLVIGPRSVITAKHCAKIKGSDLWISIADGNNPIENKESTFSKNVKRVKVISRALPNSFKLSDEKVVQLDTTMPESGNPLFDIAILHLAEDVPSSFPIFDISKAATDDDLKTGHLVAFGYSTSDVGEAGILKGYHINLVRAVNKKAKPDDMAAIKELARPAAIESCLGDDQTVDCRLGTRVKRYGMSVDSVKLFVNAGNGICEGDSGSPLFVLTAEGEYKFLGVTSEAYAPKGWIKIRETRCATYGSYQMVNPVRSWVDTELAK